MSAISSARNFRSCVAVTAVILSAACHHAAPDPNAPSPDVLRLSGLAGLPLMVAPVQSFRSAIAGVNARDLSAAARSNLDSALTDTLKQRVGNAEWVYAAALVTSFKQN